MNHETSRTRAVMLALLFGILSTIGCKNTDVLWQGRPIFEDDPRESAVRDRLVDFVVVLELVRLVVAVTTLELLPGAS